jgi:NifU-like protein
MNFYPEKISERFHAPQNVGKLNRANAVGTGATFVCGVFLRFYLRIDNQSKEITEANFQTNGCGYLIASADVLAENIVGKKLNKVHELDREVLQTEIENALGRFSENRQHCLDLTLETLQNAFADFRDRQIEEYIGEKALICTCFGVSEETIENVIKQNSLETVEEVTDVCNAGGGCGSCQILIQEMIDVGKMHKFKTR